MPQTTDQCRILIPFTTAQRYHLPEAELAAMRWSQRTGKESGFYYNTEHQRPVSPIFRGHCTSLNLPETIGAPIGERGSFHTHPNEGMCQFSGDDLLSSVEMHESEMRVACLGPNVAKQNDFDRSFKGMYRWRRIGGEKELIRRVPLWLVSPAEVRRFGHQMQHWAEKALQTEHTVPTFSAKAKDKEFDAESEFTNLIFGREDAWKLVKANKEAKNAIKEVYPNAFKSHTPRIPQVIQMFQQWEKED
jgi:hypothetical protein